MEYEDILRVSATDRTRARAELQRRFGFPQGFWHPGDLEGALEVMSGCLEDLGLSGRVSAALVQRTIDELPEIETEEGEDRARRDQIATIARHVNETTCDEAEPRLWPFADTDPGWESEEPVWLLLTLARRDELIRAGIVRSP